MLILLLHGWGFGPEIWDDLAPLLPGRVLRWDLGFFGPPDLPAPPPGPWLAVGHSHGAFHLLRQPDLAPAGFVAVNGFRRFPVASRVLDRMMARLAVSPATVVDDFRIRCEAPPITRFPDRIRLQDALRAMRDAEAPRSSCPSLALAGGCDPLLPGATSTDFGGQAVTLPEGGHLLPQTAPAWCAAQISRFRDSLSLDGLP